MYHVTSLEQAQQCMDDTYGIFAIDETSARDIIQALEVAELEDQYDRDVLKHLSEVLEQYTKPHVVTNIIRAQFPRT